MNSDLPELRSRGLANEGRELRLLQQPLCLPMLPKETCVQSSRPVEQSFAFKSLEIASKGKRLRHCPPFSDHLPMNDLESTPEDWPR